MVRLRKYNPDIISVDGESRVVDGNIEPKLTYRDHTYSAIKESSALDTWMQQSEKCLGYRYREGGKNTSVVISVSHAMGVIEVTNRKSNTSEVSEFNENEKHTKTRFGISDAGNVTVGKQYLHAAERPRGEFKADTNAGVMGVELQSGFMKSHPEITPHLICFEIPQVYAEPNKVDSSESSPIINYDFLMSIGMKKLGQYIKDLGVSNLSSEEIELLRKAEYIHSGLFHTESDDQKKEALVEAEQIIKSLLLNIANNSDDANAYKSIEATLGALKIHRSFYEKQMHLLYEKTFSPYPINIDIHTCFDQEEEKLDGVIGSRNASSAKDPEIEIILSAILRRCGFNFVLSTWNTLPEYTEMREIESLHLASQHLRESYRMLLDEKEKYNLDQCLVNRDRQFLNILLENVLRERLINMYDKEPGLLTAFIKKEIKIPESDENSKSQQSLLDLIIPYFQRKVESLSINMLQLYIQQNIIACALAKKDLHYDRLRGGLRGLSSLQNKFDFYRMSDMKNVRPAVMQIEIAQHIMKSSEKRARLQEALSEFISLVQGNNFTPQNTLQKVIK